MATGIDADLSTLRAIATQLRTTADSLDAVGQGAPTSLDAGEVTALMCGVVGRLSESAGNLVVGMREADLRVSDCRDTYERVDAAASATFQAFL